MEVMHLPDTQEELLTVQEAATFLRLHYRTVQRMLKEGRLPGRKIGKEWRIHREELVKFARGEQPK